MLILLGIVKLFMGSIIHDPSVDHLLFSLLAGLLSHKVIDYSYFMYVYQGQ